LSKSLLFWQCQDDEIFFRYKKVNLQTKRARATCFSTFAKQIEASSDDDCNCTPENLTDPLSLSLFLLSLSLLSLKLQQKVQQLRWWMQLLTVGTFHFFAFSVFAAKHHFAFIG
jgi:hypothetical protein